MKGFTKRTAVAASSFKQRQPHGGWPVRLQTPRWREGGRSSRGWRHDHVGVDSILRLASTRNMVQMDTLPGPLGHISTALHRKCQIHTRTPPRGAIQSSCQDCTVIMTVHNPDRVQTRIVLSCRGSSGRSIVLPYTRYCGWVWSALLRQMAPLRPGTNLEMMTESSDRKVAVGLACARVHPDDSSVA